MKYTLPISAILALLFCGAVVAEGKPFRLAQNQTIPSQTNFACISNCNSANNICLNQCPVAGAINQIAPDINAAQVLSNQNRIDIIQNNAPIQCRLNCTSQQACYATCR